TNSDLAFTGQYVIQGNYNGFQVWDISNPAKPSLKVGYVCPASQSDVSVYKNLLFVSSEGMGGRLDCDSRGVQHWASTARLPRRTGTARRLRTSPPRPRQRPTGAPKAGLRQRWGRWNSSCLPIGPIRCSTAWSRRVAAPLDARRPPRTARVYGKPFGK